MPIAEITAVLSTAKTAIDIAKGISALNAEVKRNESISKILEALIAIQSEALSMQEKYQGLLEEKNEIASQLKEFEQWADTERLYELKDLGGNVFVYAYKKTESSAEPMHYLCTNCFKDKKKSILQFAYADSSGTGYKCHNCNLLVCDRTKSNTDYNSTYNNEPDSWMGR